MSERVTTNYYTYQGRLGEVVRDGVFFFARKDGFPIGTYSTFEEAMASLAWKFEATAIPGSAEFIRNPLSRISTLSAKPCLPGNSTPV